MHADQAVEDLFEGHYRVLVQVAALLTGDMAAAEHVVQSAFAAMHRAWCRLGGRDAGLRYLRQEVLRRARSCRPAWPGVVSARQSGGADAVSSPALLILQGIPFRQREALVLRYVVGLPAEEIAGVMRVRPRTMRRQLERGVAAFAAAAESDL